MSLVSSGDWVLLVYRLPREPSTPRIALWRALRRLGAVHVTDGVVTLPADSRTREQLEWLADGVLEAGGEASVWLARPGSTGHERKLARQMRDAVTAEYEAVIADTGAALALPPGQRKRTLGRLRRELRRVRRRDYFHAPARDQAAAALEELAASVEQVAA
jgi:hypothetical protein